MSYALTDPCTWPAWRLARLIVDADCDDLPAEDVRALVAMLVADLAAEALGPFLEGGG
jgi:hypothetical protein